MTEILQLSDAELDASPDSGDYIARLASILPALQTVGDGKDNQPEVRNR
jgi:hypothetical protein